MVGQNFLLEKDLCLCLYRIIQNSPWFCASTILASTQILVLQQIIDQPPSPLDGVYPRIFEPWTKWKQRISVVVSNSLYFHPDPWGNDPIWRAYFSNGLKPPTRIEVEDNHTLGGILGCPRLPKIQSQSSWEGWIASQQVSQTQKLLIKIKIYSIHFLDLFISGEFLTRSFLQFITQIAFGEYFFTVWKQFRQI